MNDIYIVILWKTGREPVFVVFDNKIQALKTAKYYQSGFYFDNGEVSKVEIIFHDANNAIEAINQELRKNKNV